MKYITWIGYTGRPEPAPARPAGNLRALPAGAPAPAAVAAAIAALPRRAAPVIQLKDHRRD